MNRFFLKTIFVVLIIGSCQDAEPNLIFENSSKSNPMEIEYSLNGTIKDTIKIPVLSGQNYQWSIRRKIGKEDLYNLIFKELNNGKVIRKKIKSINSDYCFVILGNDDSNNKLRIDTFTLNYIPAYQ